MTQQELKELQKRMIKNKANLQERLIYSEIILDTINILISYHASDTMIEIWFSSIEREIEEIKEVLDIIER